MRPPRRLRSCVALDGSRPQVLRGTCEGAVSALSLTAPRKRGASDLTTASCHNTDYTHNSAPVCEQQTAENAVAAHHVRCQGVVEASLSTRSLATSRRRSTRNITTTSSTVIRRTTSTAMPPSACRWSRRRSRRPPPPPQASRSTRVGTQSPLACSRRQRRRRTRDGTARRRQALTILRLQAQQHPERRGDGRNADMELKIKAWATMAGAPVPTPRDRVYF